MSAASIITQSSREELIELELVVAVVDWTDEERVIAPPALRRSLTHIRTTPVHIYTNMHYRNNNNNTAYHRNHTHACAHTIARRACIRLYTTGYICTILHAARTRRRRRLLSSSTVFFLMCVAQAFSRPPVVVVINATTNLCGRRRRRRPFVIKYRRQTVGYY